MIFFPFELNFCQRNGYFQQFFFEFSIKSNKFPTTTLANFATSSCRFSSNGLLSNGLSSFVNIFFCLKLLPMRSNIDNVLRLCTMLFRGRCRFQLSPALSSKEINEVMMRLMIEKVINLSSISSCLFQLVFC